MTIRRLGLLTGLTAAVLLFPSFAGAGVVPATVFTIIGDTEVYSTEGGGGRPVGRIAPYQSVTLAPDGPFSWVDERPENPWLKVTTWLGDKWIRDDDRVLYGEFREQRQTLTLMGKTRLFARPDYGTETGESLAPQRVVSTASIGYAPKQITNAMSAAAQSGTWYRIDTSWRGPVWIANPALMENVRAEAVDYNVLLTGQEMAYPAPYPDGEGEKVEAGAVQVVARWEDRRVPFTASIWYQVKLPQGMRWIHPEHEALENYRKEEESVRLNTKTRYFDQRVWNKESRLWLEPGTYTAVETIGDWALLDTSFGRKWVNLKRAPAERPEGIVEVREKVKLTSATQTYFFPEIEDVCHPAGSFAPQEAQAFERWISPEGRVWYHIATYSGTEWVPRE
ncbi:MULTISPECIES: hypothetical protein [Paenibacillus]|uniref:hypothetical protein n=1 Tax=Paenibacillus TaxID=44249 RepID=UPI0022B886A0|nr:hypothetical protein [Paenibacillus caseinilyticus]MCZ8523574.1 hypothetical protein [Paenibacillus caseinilyticus]